MPRGAWIIGALGFIAITAAALWLNQPRQPVASKALLETLLADGKPHPVGTPEGVAMAERVAKALAEAGATVTFQRTEIAGPGGQPLALVNVLGRLKGRNPGPATLVTAHHDSVAAGPGAGDDGAGVVSVIEVARTLAKEGTQRDVILLLTDGEERGLYGAIAFVAEHPWFDDVGSVVNLDARGASGPCHVYELGFNHRPLVAIMQEFLPRPMTSSFADDLYRRMPNGSDFTVYRSVGLPGFNLAFIGDVQHYHQASDVPANLDAGTLAHMQESALALARGLDRAPPIARGTSEKLAAVRSRLAIGDPTAMQELRRADLGTAPEPSAQSFASFWQRWILTFDRGLAPWFTGGLALLLLIAWSVAWYRDVLRCRAMLGGLGRVVLLTFTVGGAAAAAAWGIAHHGSVAEQGWFSGMWPIPAWPWITALWSVAFLIGVAQWQLIPRRNAWGSASAVMVVLFALLGTASVVTPASAAMLLPVLAVGTLAHLIAAILPRALARFGAAFAAMVTLWALAAVLMPLEPALIDAFGFGAGPLVMMARPLLFVVAFCVLLPGAAPAVVVVKREIQRPSQATTRITEPTSMPGVSTATAGTSAPSTTWAPPAVVITEQPPIELDARREETPRRNEWAP